MRYQAPQISHRLEKKDNALYGKGGAATASNGLKNDRQFLIASSSFPFSSLSRRICDLASSFGVPSLLWSK